MLDLTTVPPSAWSCVASSYDDGRVQGIHTLKSNDGVRRRFGSRSTVLHLTAFLFSWILQEEFDVVLLEGGKSVGGLVAGWQTPGGRPVEAGVHGFW